MVANSSHSLFEAPPARRLDSTPSSSSAQRGSAARERDPSTSLLSSGLVNRLRAAKVRATPPRIWILSFFLSRPDTECDSRDIVQGLSALGIRISVGTLPGCLRAMCRGGLLIESAGIRGRALYRLSATVAG